MSVDADPRCWCAHLKSSHSPRCTARGMDPATGKIRERCPCGRFEDAAVLDSQLRAEFPDATARANREIAARIARAAINKATGEEG